MSASSESLALADEEVEEGDWLLASSWPSTTAGSEPAEDDDDSAEEGADRESWQGRANWGDGEWEELALAQMRLWVQKPVAVTRLDFTNWAEDKLPLPPPLPSLCSIGCCC